MIHHLSFGGVPDKGAGTGAGAGGAGGCCGGGSSGGRVAAIGTQGGARLRCALPPPVSLQTHPRSPPHASLPAIGALRRRRRSAARPGEERRAQRAVRHGGKRADLHPLPQGGSGRVRVGSRRGVRAAGLCPPAAQLCRPAGRPRGVGSGAGAARRSAAPSHATYRRHAPAAARRNPIPRPHRRPFPMRTSSRKPKNTTKKTRIKSKQNA